jgi:5-methyltetrahydrofolate--homocysteine methyltransferase
MQARVPRVHQAKKARPLVAFAEARREPAPCAARGRRDAAHSSAVACSTPFPLSATRAVHRLALLLLGLGAAGEVPPGARGSRMARRRATLYGAAAAALEHRADGLADARRRLRASGRPDATADDIVLYRDETRTAEARASRCCAARCGEPFMSLADWVRRATAASRSRRRVRGHGGPGCRRARGGVTRPSGTTTRASSSKALADRLARRSPSGCTSGRGASGTRRARASPRRAAAERYRGIRPGVRLPSLSDHSQKRTLFSLLEAEQGHLAHRARAMLPAASVSGIYLGHPPRAYFGVGRNRTGSGRGIRGPSGPHIAEMERWLSPNLGYDPRASAAA